MSSKQWTTLDRDRMALALDQARRGLGLVEPNPAVGAVLVRNNRVIGQGYHHFYGAPHAEIDALRDAESHGRRVAGSTLYVTLEPCCHWGKTPPCTDAVIAAKIARVVAAVRDPSKKVAGKGLAKLRKAGIDVSVGLLAEESTDLNAWFFKFHQTGQPWVICKWAQTLDGKLAARTGHSQWISGDASRQETHRIRATCQAIVVGVQTVLADDPQLTVRLDMEPEGRPRIPNRVVLDSRLRIPVSSRLVTTARDIPTWVVTTSKAPEARRRQLEHKGVHVTVLPTDAHGHVHLAKFLTFASQQGWARVFVEGGATLHSRLLADGLADEIVIFQASSLALDDQAVQFHGKTPRRAVEFLSSYQFRGICRAGSDVVLRLVRK